VLELTVRLIASLAVVVGLMLLLARVVGKRYGARAGSPVQVLHRQPLSRSASVAVITVAGRVLVVGSTDHQVSLLTELDPDELGEPGLEEESPRPAAPTEVPTAVPTALPTAQPSELPTELPTELPADVPTLVARGGSHRATPAPRRTSSDGGALAGSVLSPQTWREAIAAATGKAS
jgi:flagellar protein FliO/FliZ